MRFLNKVLVLSLVGLQLLMASGTSQAGNQDPALDPLMFGCEGYLVNESEIALAAPSTFALGESMPFSSLLASDPSKNLVAQNPTLVMDAAQRLYSYAIYVPGSRRVLPAWKNKVASYYPILSEPNEWNGGKHVVWQFDAIHETMQYLQTLASGARTNYKIPTFLGNPGTGKTEILSVLDRLTMGMRTRSPDHKLYSFEFVGLEGIRTLHPFLPSDADGKPLGEAMPTPFYENPIALVPESLRQRVIDMGYERAEGMIGYEPTPFLSLSPSSRFFIEELYKHYFKDRKPTLQEELAVLERHVKIVPWRGLDGGSAIVDAQSQEVDYEGLFFATNPLVRTMLGPSHPLAYFYNGKILRANGGVLFLDEVLKNSAHMQTEMLGPIQSRQFSRGGSPVVPVDAVYFAASNSADVKALEKKVVSAPLFDRLRFVPMRSGIWPTDVMETMIYSYGIKNFGQRPLVSIEATTGSQASTKIEPAVLRDLIELPTTTQDVSRGPDGRFAVSVVSNKGKNIIQISPHALMYMAAITAATRMSKDAAAAKAALPSAKVIDTGVFRSVTERVRAMLGERPVELAEREELDRLSLMLEEGSFGLSNRDLAGTWFSKAIERARTVPELEGNLTLRTVREVFTEILEKNQIPNLTNAKRQEYLAIANDIFTYVILPRVTRDVMTAVGIGAGNIGETYQEVMSELRALAADPNAVNYTHPTMGERPINTIRLRQIEEKFMRNEGRRLESTEIINFAAIYGGNPLSGQALAPMRHKGLEDAILAWLADGVLRNVPLEAISRALDNETVGSPDIYDSALSFANNLERFFGYSRRSAIDAIDLVNEARIRREQAERQNNR